MIYNLSCEKKIVCTRCGNNTTTLLTITPELLKEYVCYEGRCFELGKKRVIIEQLKKEGKPIPKEMLPVKKNRWRYI